MTSCSDIPGSTPRLNWEEDWQIEESIEGKERWKKRSNRRKIETAISRLTQLTSKILEWKRNYSKRDTKRIEFYPAIPITSTYILKKKNPTNLKSFWERSIRFSLSRWPLNNPSRAFLFWYFKSLVLRHNCNDVGSFSKRRYWMAVRNQKCSLFFGPILIRLTYDTNSTSLRCLLSHKPQFLVNLPVKGQCLATKQQIYAPMPVNTKRRASATPVIPNPLFPILHFAVIFSRALLLFVLL